MKRPGGVVVNAIFLGLVSLVLLLAALVMALAATLVRNGAAAAATAGAPQVPAWMTGFELGLSAFCLGLAAWGIATVAGLFGMRRWARYSVLIIGGGLAVLGLISVLSTVVTMFAMPAPPTAGLDPQQAQTMKSMFKAVFALVAVFYGLLTVLGVTWLVYFNRKTVREAFANAAGVTLEESRRPLLVSVIAVLCMIGAPGCLLMAWLPLPATIFGFTLHGAGKAWLYVVFAVVQGVVGVGLWQLREWGRRLELVFLGLGMVNCLIYLARPSLLTKASTEVYQSMSVPTQPWTGHFQTVMYRSTFSVSILLMVALMVVLQVYRGKFGVKEEPPMAGPVVTP